MALEAPGAPTPAGCVTARGPWSGLNEACSVARGLSAALNPEGRWRLWPGTAAGDAPPERCRHGCWEPTAGRGGACARADGEQACVGARRLHLGSTRTFSEAAHPCRLTVRAGETLTMCRGGGVTLTHVFKPNLSLP